jgi:hypothetical protein
LCRSTTSPIVESCERTCSDSICPPTSIGSRREARERDRRAAPSRLEQDVVVHEEDLLALGASASASYMTRA